MRFVFAVLALLMIPLRASAFAAPATAQFVGWWTVSAGDRNLLVLHVVAENDGRLAGELWRPSYFEVSPGTVGSIRGPVLRESASDLKLEEGGLTFTAANPRDAKDSDRWLLKIASSGEAALRFEAFQTLPMKATPLRWRRTIGYQTSRTN